MYVGICIRFRIISSDIIRHYLNILMRNNQIKKKDSLDGKSYQHKKR